MSTDSPAVVIFSSLGVEVSAVNGSSISSTQSGLMIDGYNYSSGLAQLMAVDASGHPIIIGSGTAGTAATGVVTIQGIAGMTAITVNNATAANFLANIGGIGAAGSAPSGNPVYVGASVTTAVPSYSNNTMNALSLTTAGALRVDGSGAIQPVSGTVTANAGSGTFTVGGTVTANIGTTNGLALDATLAKLTVAQSAALGSNTQALVGGSVTTTSPTYTTGNINPLSLTTAGALRIDGSAVTQPVSGTVTSQQGSGSGVASTYWYTRVTDGAHTMPTADAIARPLFSKITDGINSVAVTSGSALTVDGSGVTQPISGTITAQQGSGSGVASTYWYARITDGGHTMPTADAIARPLFSKITDGTNSAAITVASALMVDGSAVTQPISGTVTAQQGAGSGSAATYWYARITDGGHTMPTADSIGRALYSKITDGSNSAAVTSGGALMVDGSAVVQPIAFVDAFPATQNITARDIGSIASGGAFGQGVITGTPSAGSTATFPLSSYTTVQFQISGTWNATLQPEISIDGGTTWYQVYAFLTGTFSQINSFNLNGSASVDVTGATHFRIRSLSFTSGTATITVVKSENVPFTTPGVTGVVPNGNPIGIIPSFDPPPGNPVIVAGWDNSNVRTILTDTSGRPIIVGEGTAGSPAGGVVSVQGVSSGTALTVSGTVNIGGTGGLALDTSVTGLQVTQGSTTAGQKGDLILGAVTTSAPTYTTGQTSPLSLTTAGALRVDATATTQNVSIVSSDGVAESFGNGRMQVSQNTLLFWDSFESSSLNNDRWTFTTNGMTAAQSTASGGFDDGAITINNGADTTLGDYVIMSSVKSFISLQEFPLYFSADIYINFPAAGTLQRFGFGTQLVSGAAPTDGIWYDIINGVSHVNLRYKHYSTQIINLPIQVPVGIIAKYTILVADTYVKFTVQELNGAYSTSLVVPTNANFPKLIAFHQPVFFFNFVQSPGVTTAPIMEISNVIVSQLDLATDKPWVEQLAGSGYSAILDQNTFTQSANYTNNTAPVSASLSNTVASYTTLGGLFQFAAVSGAETDYALFAYKVPVPTDATYSKDLIVYSITIDSFVTGAANTSSPTILQWAVGINSNGVSLATGGNSPPIITPIGMQQTSTLAAIGSNFSPGPLVYKPKTPLVIHSGRYLHIILRIPVGNNTSSQVIRGYVSIDGVFDA